MSCGLNPRCVRLSGCRCADPSDCHCDHLADLRCALSGLGLRCARRPFLWARSSDPQRGRLGLRCARRPCLWVRSSGPQRGHLGLRCDPVACLAPSDPAAPSELAVCPWAPLALAPETRPSRPFEAPAFLADLLVAVVVPVRRHPPLPDLSGLLALQQKPYSPAEEMLPSSELRM